MNIGRHWRPCAGALGLLVAAVVPLGASVLVTSNAGTQAAFAGNQQQEGVNGAHAYDIWHGTNTSNATLLSNGGSGALVGVLPSVGDVLAAAAVSMDGISGKVRSTNMVPSPQWLGTASTRAELSDAITVLSPSLTLTLDAFFESFSITAPIPYPSFDYKALVTYYLSVNLREIDGDASFNLGIVMQNSFENPYGMPVGDWIRSIRLTKSDGVNDEDVETLFTTAPNHVGNALTIDTSALIGVPLTLHMTMTSTATCEGTFYQGALGGACTASSVSWNTGHLGLQGEFVSENGYQYLGVVDENTVPEPSSLGLAIVGLALGVVARRQGGHNRARIFCGSTKRKEGR